MKLTMNTIIEKTNAATAIIKKAVRVELNPIHIGPKNVFIARGAAAADIHAPINATINIKRNIPSLYLVVMYSLFILINLLFVSVVESELFVDESLESDDLNNFPPIFIFKIHFFSMKFSL
jgi:hypothetical protein